MNTNAIITSNDYKYKAFLEIIESCDKSEVNEIMKSVSHCIDIVNMGRKVLNGESLIDTNDKVGTAKIFACYGFNDYFLIRENGETCVMCKDGLGKLLWYAQGNRRTPIIQKKVECRWIYYLKRKTTKNKSSYEYIYVYRFVMNLLNMESVKIHHWVGVYDNRKCVLSYENDGTHGRKHTYRNMCNRMEVQAILKILDLKDKIFYISSDDELKIFLYLLNNIKVDAELDEAA